MAVAPNAATIAYDLTSCAYRLICGKITKIRPAASPAAGETSRRPSAATAAAATAIATTEGSLVTSSPEPATRTTGHMIM